MLSFPSPTAAPSVLTEFVNGVKFDICEVVKEAYSLLSDKKYRFLLCVEDTFIVNYSAAEKWNEATGQDRWEFFCATKADCIAMIKDYSDKCEQVARWRELMQQKSGISPMILPKISAANDSSLARYGVKIAA